jgi:hypothetical protein
MIHSTHVVILRRASTAVRLGCHDESLITETRAALDDAEEVLGYSLTSDCHRALDVLPDAPVRSRLPFARHLEAASFALACHCE